MPALTPAHITTDITLTAVGGMVNMVATIPPPDGKAIFTTDGDHDQRIFV